MNLAILTIYILFLLTGCSGNNTDPYERAIVLVKDFKIEDVPENLKSQYGKSDLSAKYGFFSDLMRDKDIRLRYAKLRDQLLKQKYLGNGND